MKDPAFLFYSGDFTVGTQMMSYEDKGKFIHLMCLQHQTGHLTEKHMLQVCGTHESDVFSKFKKDNDGLYYNERLDAEIAKRKAYSQSRANNRRKKDDEKDMYKHMNQTSKDINHTSNSMNQLSNSYAPHMENENENRNIVDNTVNISNADFQEIRKNENIKQLAAYAHSAMKDQMWREAMAKTGIVDRALLAEWVKVFVKKLVFENDIEKTEAEFRKYFKNWVVKCENYHTSLNYEKYDPSYEHPKQQIPASEQFRPIVINKQIEPNE
jgi:hypothetical protein